MKTIGVLGGTGPQATMDFERRLHVVSQRLIPPKANTGYPPMVVYYHRRPPVVVNDDLTPVLPLAPDPALLEAAAWLGPRADFIVMPCNTVHLFRAEVERAAGRPILSMIDVTVAEVRRLGWRRVGLLGYGDPRVTFYAEPLTALGIGSEIIDAALQTRLTEAIGRLAEGRESAESRAAAAESVAVLRARGVDGVIPGCTEIPLLLGPAADAGDLVNPLQLLAEAAVRRAMD